MMTAAIVSTLLFDCIAHKFSKACNNTTTVKGKMISSVPRFRYFRVIKRQAYLHQFLYFHILSRKYQVSYSELFFYRQMLVPILLS